MGEVIPDEPPVMVIDPDGVYCVLILVYSPGWPGCDGDYYAQGCCVYGYQLIAWPALECIYGNELCTHAGHTSQKLVTTYGPWASHLACYNAGCGLT